MITQTLQMANEDWAHESVNPREILPCDNLIAMATGFIRQTFCATAPLTAEDAAIILNRAPMGLRIDDDGNYVAFGNGQDRALRFVCSLNA